MLTQNEIRLRERVEELEEENRQLRDLLAPPDLACKIRRAFGLQQAGCKQLACLATGSVFKTKTQLFNATRKWGDECMSSVNIKIVDVNLVHIRRALQRVGLSCSVETVWGMGYRLIGRDELLRYVEEKTADAA